WMTRAQVGRCLGLRGGPSSALWLVRRQYHSADRGGPLTADCLRWFRLSWCFLNSSRTPSPKALPLTLANTSVSWKFRYGRKPCSNSTKVDQQRRVPTVQSTKRLVRHG